MTRELLALLDPQLRYGLPLLAPLDELRQARAGRSASFSGAQPTPPPTPFAEAAPALRLDPCFASMGLALTRLCVGAHDGGLATGCAVAARMRNTPAAALLVLKELIAAREEVTALRRRLIAASLPNAARQTQPPAASGQPPPTAASRPQ
jgi:hypothetical protein